MVGQVLWWVWGRGWGEYVHPHTHVKRLGIPYTYIHAQSM